MGNVVEKILGFLEVNEIVMLSRKQFTVALARFIAELCETQQAQGMKTLTLFGRH